MKKINRVFFKSESQAGKAGFRPCSHCQLRKKRVELCWHLLHL
ncbi:MAG TPA: Ada metal-binding domain-containing protein [Cyclobacteriaceae bacterium]|nr:Ada metal-binding domain-containing protein [Cyclobacteriaceae bacterium]